MKTPIMYAFRWILIVLLVMAAGCATAKKNPASSDDSLRRTIQVHTIYTGVTGRLGPTQETLLRAYLEAGLVAQGMFRLSTNAELNVTVQITSYIPPSPTRYETDSQGRRILVSSPAGGTISVLADVSDRSGTPPKTYLVVENLLPDRSPFDSESALQRVGRQIALYVASGFGRR